MISFSWRANRASHDFILAVRSSSSLRSCSIATVNRSRANRSHVRDQPSPWIAPWMAKLSSSIHTFCFWLEVCMCMCFPLEICARRQCVRHCWWCHAMMMPFCGSERQNSFMFACSCGSLVAASCPHCSPKPSFMSGLVATVRLWRYMWSEHYCWPAQWHCTMICLIQRRWRPPR